MNFKKLVVSNDEEYSVKRKRYRPLPISMLFFFLFFTYEFYLVDKESRLCSGAQLPSLPNKREKCCIIVFLKK